MTYDPNDLNRDADLRTTPIEYRRSNAWIGWAAAIAVVAVATFAYMEWTGAPDTDRQTTASTTNSAPAPAPATPIAPPGNNAAPAPVTPSTGGTQQ
jgi:hypothetical protein